MATLRERCAALLGARASNHQIALGLAVGVCVSFFPVYGPQIPFCLLLALVFRRLNKVAVLLGVQFSWLYPVVVWLDYHAGRMVWPGGAAGASLPSLAEMKAEGFGRACLRLAALAKGLFPVMLAGSVVAGVAAGELAFMLALALLGLVRGRAGAGEGPPR